MMASSAVAAAFSALVRGPVPSARERCVSNSGSVSRAQIAAFDELRRGLLTRYLGRTPSAVAAVNLLAARGANMHNDHVAMRSFVDSRGQSGLAFLVAVFRAFGYAVRDPVVIPGLPVNATWLEPPEQTDWPKVFVSELRASELPAAAADIVHSHVDRIYADHTTRLPQALAADAPSQPELLLELLDAPPWAPTAAEVERIRAVGAAEPSLANATEYAAWTLTHGHRINHMTILQNTLGMEGVNNLQDLNLVLRESGLDFNPAGGEDGMTQGSRQVNLQQSSTRADLVTHTFGCGAERRVPCAFLELIQRHDGFAGFLGQNAKGIFSSTHRQ
jgi:hypothetical protein